MSWHSSRAYSWLCLHSNTKETTSAHLSHSVAKYHAVPDVLRLLKMFRNNFCHCTIITSENVEEPKYKKQKNMMSLLDKLGVLCKLDSRMSISLDYL